jgi:hypothetical protein
LSVFEQTDARLHIVDASTMAPLTARPFPSLATMGTGRIDTYQVNFYTYKATTCILNLGNLRCETINYHTGASVSVKTVADASANLYDPALCSTPEGKFFLVATKTKFYVFDPETAVETPVKEMAMVAGFDV